MKAVIVGMARSGTSFLGELFRQNPEVRYVFEPFWGDTPIRREQLIWRTESDDWPEGRVLVQGILDGQIEGLCQDQTQPYDPKTFTSRRQELEHQVGSGPESSESSIAIKCIRLNMQLRWLARNTDPDVKIVHIVRDPRGVAASFLMSDSPLRTDSNTGRLRRLVRDRMRRGGQSETFYHHWGWDEIGDDHAFSQDFAGYWETLVHGKAHERIAARWGLFVGQAISDAGHLDDSRYQRLRYEDLCTHPLETAEGVYEFLGSPLPLEVRTWLTANTVAGDRRDRYGTARDSIAMVDVWKHQLAKRDIRDIEELCGHWMERAGYPR